MIWLCLCLVVVAWVMTSCAAASGYALEDARDGVDRDRSVSLGGGLVLGLVLWCVGLLVDLALAPWGSRSVAALHGFLLLSAGWVTVANIVRLVAVGRRA